MMFRRSTELAERFAKLFKTDADGTIYYRPDDERPGLPVSDAEKIRLIGRFRRQTRAATTIGWVLAALALAALGANLLLDVKVPVWPMIFLLIVGGVFSAAFPAITVAYRLELRLRERQANNEG